MTKEYVELKKAAQKGDDNDLDVLVKHPNYRIRVEVAKHGRTKDLDILVNDKTLSVLREVMKHGREQDFNVLVEHRDHSVRKFIAAYGMDKHLDILINDKNKYVRAWVLKFHERPQDIESVSVKNDIPVIKYLLEHSYSDIFFNVFSTHPNPFIRSLVVVYGGEKYHKLLSEDPDPKVREVVAFCCDYKYISSFFAHERNLKVLNIVTDRLMCPGENYEMSRDFEFAVNSSIEVEMKKYNKLKEE